MSTREEWEEVCRWVYSSSEIDKDNTNQQFCFFINDKDRLCYYYLNYPTIIRNWIDINVYNANITNGYYKIRLIQELCGPVQPPPSPIIQKIRNSYIRQRDHYGIAI